MDMMSGYWQVRMSLEDKIKTAFSTYQGLYEFNVKGLAKAPATFHGGSGRDRSSRDQGVQTVRTEGLPTSRQELSWSVSGGGLINHEKTAASRTAETRLPHVLPSTLYAKRQSV